MGNKLTIPRISNGKSDVPRSWSSRYSALQGDPINFGHLISALNEGVTSQKSDATDLSETKEQDSVKVISPSLDVTSALPGLEKSSDSNTDNVSSVDVLDKLDDDEDSDVAEKSSQSFDISSQLKSIGKNRDEILISSVTKRAEPKSVGKCAKYVRLGLNDAGIYFTHNQPAAANYATTLQSDSRFKYQGQIDPTASDPPLGSILVYTAAKNIPYGHIQVNTPSGWVSDFKQKTIIPGTKYANALQANTIQAHLFTLA